LGIESVPKLQTARGALLEETIEEKSMAERYVSLGDPLVDGSAVCVRSCALRNGVGL
jgi:hypothetical protein